MRHTGWALGTHIELSKTRISPEIAPAIWEVGLLVAAAVTIIQQKYNRQHRAQIRLRGLIGAIPEWLHS
jgi:hypothetical protein